MLHRRRRLAARFLAIGLLAATLSAVDSLALPGTAEARCIGVGNPVRSTFSYNGTVRVSETPVTGTCNGNQAYSGTLKDERADGNCVSVWFMESATGGQWISPGSGYTCGGTSSFEWHDLNGNSRVYERFCLEDPDTGPFVCGWGSTINDFGTNYGY